MESELQFFMTAKDQDEFLEIAKPLVDSINPEEDFYIFEIGGCTMKFTPSKIESNSSGDTMYTGKLRIDTFLGSGIACKEEERAKRAFKKLRSWMKKNYWSRLAYLNKKKKNKLTPSRAYWVGPNAKDWKEANSEQHIFKLSATSWMIFEIGI